MPIARKKTTESPDLPSRELNKILDSAQALAKGRRKQTVSLEELFLAVACIKRHRRNFPDDLADKISFVVKKHAGSLVSIDQDACKLLSKVEHFEKAPEKQVDLLVRWIKNHSLKNRTDEIIKLFRKEAVCGVKTLSRQARLLKHLHEIERGLHYVKGQDKAIDQVLKLIAGWLFAPAGEPSKSLKIAFSGPPSCGKRLLATSLAQSLKLENGEPMPFLEIDLKGYCSHQNWEGLMGHSSSYSSGKEGLLTGFVKNNPRCVLLFSHLESAHENTIGALGPVFLNGEAVDRYEDTRVDFSRCIIIVTTGRELGVESGFDSSVTAELAKNEVFFKELSHSCLYGICWDAVQQYQLVVRKKLEIKLTGITNSLAYYLVAGQMPDVNVRNISEAAMYMIWEKVFDACTFAVKSGLEQATNVEIRCPVIGGLETSPDFYEVAGGLLKRLTASRRRVVFRCEISIEGATVIIELLDIHEEMVPAPSERGLILEGIPECGLESVIGHADAVGRLRNLARLLSDGRCDAAVPRGILLHGAPGTGKTACAKGFAAEAGTPMISVSASDLLSPLAGETAKKIRHAFSVCKKYAMPTHSVLFIDEIDTLAQEREATTELLTCMQGVHDFNNVLVVGTTNCPDALDDALLRRFDMKIFFELPGPIEREKILTWYMNGLKAADGIRLGVIARMAVGLSGAYLQDMVNDAKRLALERGDEVIAEADLQTSLENIMFGESSRKCVYTDEERRIVAYHEAGHAVLLLHLSPETARDLAGVSILTRKDIGGVMLREDNSNISHIQKVVDMIAVLLGGIEAEKICLGIESTGCVSDLQKAVSTAEKLVLCFGYRMDGQITGNGMGYYQYVDEATRARAAEQVRLLLIEQRNRSAVLIEEHKEAVENVAGALMLEERLSADRILSLINYKEAA